MKLQASWVQRNTEHQFVVDLTLFMGHSNTISCRLTHSYISCCWHNTTQSLYFCLTGATVCVWEISVSSRPSAVIVTPDFSNHVNWNPSTAAGSSACWDSLQRNTVSRVPLTCWKSAVSRSGRSTTFLPAGRRSDTRNTKQFLQLQNTTCDQSSISLIRLIRTTI